MLIEAYRKAILNVMPKLDIIHNAVKNAMIKDGWIITDDPYIIQYRRTILYADLGAERPIAIERDGQKLVVEVKSFLGTSKIQDLKEALGQYDIYRYLLEETAPDRKLYVAVSAIAFSSFFKQDVIQLILNKHQLPLIIVDTETEEITQWIN
ncbi:fdxN element excision controlling factor XisH [Chroococcus sp. FPU101]|nr:fdxN element excision controlling factor XisH [Chroococcus sp. FPU101]